MSSIPARKSIFAPTLQARQETPQSPSRATLFKEKEKVSIQALPRAFSLSPAHSPCSLSSGSEAASSPSKALFRKVATQVYYPKSPSTAYKRNQTTKSKSRFSTATQSPKATATQMHTPLLFKEYKYKRSESGDILVKEDSNNQKRTLKSLSTFSTLAYKIINTRPQDSGPKSQSKLQLGSNGSVTKNRLSQKKSVVFDVNTPSIVSGMNDKHLLSLPSSRFSDTEEEERVFTERKKLRRTLKKGFYAIYFVGIMLAYKNKVMIYGALRPLEYLEEFESLRFSENKGHSITILPGSSFSFFWGIVMILFLILTAILTPIYISFVEDDNQLFYYLNLCMDIGFGIDIVINFFTGYYDQNNELVTDIRKIALNYLRAWFWIDIISIIPLNNVIDLISSNDGSINTQANKITKFLRFPRLYRLIKIVRLAKLAKLFSSNQSLSQLNKKLSLNSRIIKVFKIFIDFAFLNHLVGCIWFYLVYPLFDESYLTLKAKLDDFGPDTWVGRADLMDEDIETQYIASIYWSFQTLTTVGYGDIAPQTSLERSISTVWIVLGVLIYSFTVGNLSAILLSFEKIWPR